MSRSIVALIVVLVLLVGALFFFSSRGGAEKEPTRIEKVVPLDNLTK